MSSSIENLLPMLALMVLLSFHVDASRPRSFPLQVEVYRNHMKRAGRVKGEAESSSDRGSQVESGDEGSQDESDGGSQVEEGGASAAKGGYVAGSLKARMQDMQQMLSGEVEGNFDSAMTNAESTKQAAQDWAKASKEMHDVALKGWTDSAKGTLEQMEKDHKDVEGHVRGHLVFNGARAPLDPVKQIQRMRDIVLIRDSKMDAAGPALNASDGSTNDAVAPHRDSEMDAAAPALNASDGSTDDAVAPHRDAAAPALNASDHQGSTNDDDHAQQWCQGFHDPYGEGKWELVGGIRQCTFESFGLCSNAVGMSECKIDADCPRGSDPQPPPVCAEASNQPEPPPVEKIKYCHPGYGKGAASARVDYCHQPVGSNSNTYCTTQTGPKGDLFVVECGSVPPPPATVNGQDGSSNEGMVGDGED